MEQEIACVNLEDIALQMTSSLNLNEVLTTISQGLVDELGAAFARIWLLGPGDLCDECFKSSSCRNQEQCLHLKASAGMYTNLSGEHRRIPLDHPPLGRVAIDKKPIFSEDLINDNRFPNKEWIKANEFCCYAGYPLVFRDELLGTTAIFGQSKMPQSGFEHVAGFANQASIAIKNAQLFGEVEQLKNQLQTECNYLREEIKGEHNFEEIIGQSDVLKSVLFRVEQVAPSDTTVLLLGETGVGKELIARAIHQLSFRNARPLVKVSCATLPANLIESELFGHEKGAYTGAEAKREGRFEVAHGGTLFLDEIGELPLELQTKLLRMLQDGEFERLGSSQTMSVDVRVIAATNRDLEQDVGSGRFRKDLYYRLQVFPITVPPLRDRREDIPLLVRFFVERFARKAGKTIDTVPAEALEVLQRYPWPGNVRELQNVIERAVINTRGPGLRLMDTLAAPAVLGLASPRTLAESEAECIVRTLEATHWKIEGQDGAAKALGVPASTLRNRMQKHGIHRPQKP